MRFEPLRDVVYVGRDFGWFQMRPVFVNGEIDLGESKIANGTQRLLKRVLPKTERGTGNKHGPPPLVFVAIGTDAPPNVRASAHDHRFQNPAHTQVGRIVQEEKSDRIGISSAIRKQAAIAPGRYNSDIPPTHDSARRERIVLNRPDRFV